MNFNCPFCESPLSIEKPALGSVFACPQCGQKVVVKPAAAQNSDEFFFFTGSTKKNKSKSASKKQRHYAKQWMMRATVAMFICSAIAFYLGYSSMFHNVRDLHNGFSMVGAEIEPTNTAVASAVFAGMYCAFGVLVIYFLVVAVLAVIWFADRPD